MFSDWAGPTLEAGASTFQQLVQLCAQMMHASAHARNANAQSDCSECTMLDAHMLHMACTPTDPTRSIQPHTTTFCTSCCLQSKPCTAGGALGLVRAPLIQHDAPNAYVPTHDSRQRTGFQT